ncbi:MAG TPA: SH3 domain-containing protein, partial [Verrucomicrobiae bacterium]|nr:SH3 domain-containing protein [Verrucomicrobiae bacterium]
MKLNCCLMLGVMVAFGATAQNSTNSLPSIPPPATSPAMVAPAPALVAPPEVKTNAPAKKAAAKKKKAAKAKVAATKPAAGKAAAAKTPALNETSAPLVAGSAEVVVNNVNVRGQAGLKGEVISHLQKGDTVTVLSQIGLDKHKADEPAQWAKIALPTNVTVWVNSKFIDEKAKTVTPKKLNLRAGPGENYSVLGVVEHGDTITESGAKGDWTKIEAPANSYAFIAAMYLKQEASGNVPVNP